MPRIFNISHHTQIAVLAVAPLVSFTPAVAETQASVLQDDLSCILQNAEDYRAQGDKITLNFETCPQRPTTREELQAHKARNFFPPRTSDDAQVSILLVTKQEFDCLLDSLQSIESDPETGRLLILPDQCQVDSP